MTELHITPAREADLPAAAAVLARAFRDDPVMAAILPGSRRLERLTTLFTAMLRGAAFETGSVDLARRADRDEILGVAAWEGPGAASLPWRRLPEYLAALGLPGLVRAAVLSSRLARHRPRSPHWYLAQIGVSPAARGLGVGGALLRSRLDTLDVTRATAYLESSTPDNRRLYSRLGFEEIAPIRGIRGATPTAMLRPPAPARHAVPARGV
ncbi:GNAT family N-acetyltransferase [Microbacterium testaceum]|uniref:N-acetyltransferase n=1 Tax=Microbacterium testaceum TaxID=2033 RepID=A0A4Y3QNY7_MICTE|nr:GNAT family N-acetyltransferase [Microbacterium testaceum]MDZ5145156.1 GNAT family N-acetyltransferase [Microbacterium testaceum]GEB46679.1 N-acetyltransferase [Microbacterium testaceum]